MVLFLALLAVAVGANILCPKRCSLVGEQCDCLGQPCCDTALSCSGGVCVGTPSVPNNDQLQQYRSALNPSLDGTNIFASAGRRFPKEVFDGRTYPAGVLEPAAGRPTRIFQETVEIGIPQACCTPCNVNGECGSSGGCICDSAVFSTANCAIGNNPPGQTSCPVPLPGQCLDFGFSFSSRHPDTSTTASGNLRCCLSNNVDGKYCCLAGSVLVNSPLLLGIRGGNLFPTLQSCLPTIYSGNQTDLFDNSLYLRQIQIPSTGLAAYFDTLGTLFSDVNGAFSSQLKAATCGASCGNDAYELFFAFNGAKRQAVAASVTGSLSLSVNFGTE